MILSEGAVHHPAAVHQEPLLHRGMAEAPAVIMAEAETYAVMAPAVKQTVLPVSIARAIYVRRVPISEMAQAEAAEAEARQYTKYMARFLEIPTIMARRRQEDFLHQEKLLCLA